MTPDAAPTLEERLRAALDEVAQCVTVDPLPPVWEDDDPAPRSTRTRALVAAGVAIALAVGVAIAVSAAMSGRDSGHGAPVSNATPETTAVPFVDDGALTSPRVYAGGSTTLLPPPSGTRPKSTASEAYAARSGYPWGHEPLRPHVLLADATVSDYGNVRADGTIKPIIDNRLVWVIVYDDVPVGDLRHVGGPAPKHGNTLPPTVPVDPSTPSGETVLVFVDATTGSPIISKGFPGSFTTPKNSSLIVTMPDVAGAWRPVSIQGLAGPFTSPATPSITFDGHSSWFGYDGCNRVNGAYVRKSPDTVRLKMLGETQADCGGPGSGMFGSGTLVRSVNGRLTFSTASGTRLAQFVRVATTP